MEKDSIVNTRTKRRSKNAEESNPEPDIYKKSIDFEEQEAKSRDSKEDSLLYLSTCEKIKLILVEIFKLKCEPNENKVEIKQKCRECYMHLSILKKLNRLEKVRMQACRETLNEEKQKLENLTLQFQNLLYELDHLLSEYCKCKQYKSKDEDIELISTQEFLQIAPDGIKTKFLDAASLDDPSIAHELHLAMLEHELYQRIELFKQCEDLEVQKKQLTKDILTRKEKLDALDPKYDAVVAAAKVLQQQLGFTADEIRPEHDLAHFLPNQLYLLYCNAEVYKEVRDPSMEVDILGELAQVKLWNEERNAIGDISSDIEEVEEVVEVVKKHRRGGKTTEVVDKQEEKRKKLLQQHPLALKITISGPGEYTLKITFTYRPRLRLVTVVSSVDIPGSLGLTGNCARDVLNGESILNELFPGDFGTESPNLANSYQFKEFGFTSYECLVSKIGFAYGWAQKLCGQNFLELQKQGKKSEDLNFRNVMDVENTFQTISKRLKSRFLLAQQLQYLEVKTIPPIPEAVIYPRSVDSTLIKFQSISYQTFCTDTHNARSLVDSGMVTGSDLFYSAIVARQKATLKASIIIKNDYPFKAPIFILKVSNNGEENSDSSDELRDMERAVNIVVNTEDNASYLLSLQLRYLCSYLDVYLETNEGSTFPRNTVFFQNVSGRNRRRPFKYKKIGNGIFTQF